MKHIYLDLDGVLVNLEEAFGYYYSDKPYSETWQQYEKRVLKTTIFKKIYEETTPEEFWSNLNPMPDYMVLVDYVIKAVGEKNVFILSAPTKEYFYECASAKIDYTRKIIPYNIRCNVVKRENKKVFANKDAILIDDMSLNVIEWTMAGGIGILHTNIPNTLLELKKLGI